MYGDFFWAQLRASGSALALRTPFTGVALTADATGHLKFTVKAILEGGGAYELARWSNWRRVLHGHRCARRPSLLEHQRQCGARHHRNGQCAAAGAEPGRSKGGRQTGDLNWVDPLVGVRVRQQLASGDEFQLKGDIGGFGAGSKISWQAFGGYMHNFEFSGLNWSSMIGYRAFEVDYSRGGGLQQSGLNAVLQGPIVGIGVRF